MSDYQTFRRNGAAAELDFAVEAPTNWVPVPLPDETPQFDDPMTFAPIGVLMAPYAAIVFSVTARPAYSDGTLVEWLDHVVRARGIDPSTIERELLGDLDAVACWGFQVENGIAMRARMVLFEDGGRMVNVSCMAPADLWSATAPTFVHMLRTFALTHRRGRTATVCAEGVSLPASTMTGPGAVAESAPTPAAAVALADDLGSLDPEHPLNARLRDAGAGLVPNVLDHDQMERWARLGAGAIRATMRVPFGWHVLDDGRRTLVFDADGRTQISMQLLAREGRSDDAILAAKVPDLRREWPTMEHLRTEVSGLQCLLVRNATADGQPIEQAYLLRSAPEGLVLQTRVTSSPDTFARAGDLAEVLLRDLHIVGEVAV
ncbi:MAG: hypothetical protein IT456_25275 [Planctomycetes bacterium]|nr:hypothetical protein [Planctomycetota bacterium]MCC7066132.1 hypothetical protein [Planctomycetota bacterium]